MLLQALLRQFDHNQKTKQLQLRAHFIGSFIGNKMRSLKSLDN